MIARLQSSSYPMQLPIPLSGAKVQWDFTVCTIKFQMFRLAAFVNVGMLQKVAMSCAHCTDTPHCYKQTCAGSILPVVVVILYCHDDPWPIRHIEL